MYGVGYLQEGDPNRGLGWLLSLILGGILLFLVIAWWLNRRKAELDAIMPEPGAGHEENPTQDDLTRIEGIGPKVAGVLNQGGVTTFQALANANAPQVKEMLNAAGLQMMNPEGWIEQARLAANGEWSELEKLQSQLKGGRRK